MDTSKEYILMCEKAEEIQELRKDRKDFDIGDFYSSYLYNGYKWAIYTDCEGALSVFYNSNMFWLPRQDQLQEMFGIKNPYELIGIFEEWNDYEVKLFNSMEQLWLAFVMKEKYQKIWNGKEWIVA